MTQPDSLAALSVDYPVPDRDRVFSGRVMALIARRRFLLETGRALGGGVLALLALMLSAPALQALAASLAPALVESVLLPALVVGSVLFLHAVWQRPGRILALLPAGIRIP
ncbi:hypothetical protein [Maricaulis sp. CAU 1757]